MSAVTDLPDTGLEPGQSRDVSRQRVRRNLWWLLLLPNLGFLIVFFGYPIFDVLRQSLTDFTPPQANGFDNYQWFFETPANSRILIRTLVTAGIVTAGCLLLAYPYAYYMTVVGARTRRLLIAIVLVPFWTSLIVRNFAWVVLLEPNGPINGIFEFLGLGQVHLLGTLAGVAIGEIQILLPFVVLPLYARLRTIDRRLLDAAGSLGAPSWRAFVKVYLPLSIPGVLSGGLLAFGLSLGFYITPALLGSSQQQLLSPLIVTQVNQLLALGRAGAMAAILLLTALIVIALAYIASRARISGGDGASIEPSGEVEVPRRRPILGSISTAIGVLLVLPSLVVIPLSFTAQKTFSFPPSDWSLRWWRGLMTDGTWTTALLNSLAIASICAILATVLGTAAALGMSRSGFPGKGVVSALFLAPLVTPLVVAGIGIYIVYLGWHLNGTLVGFVVAHTALAVPFVIVPVSAALRGFDRRLEAAAASLGANSWTTFRSVTLPLIRPAVLAGALFAFATSLDETVVSLFLVSPGYRTLPVEIFTSITRDVDPTVAAASSLVLGITTVLVLILFTTQVRRERKEAMS